MTCVLASEYYQSVMEHNVYLNEQDLAQQRLQLNIFRDSL